MSVPIPITEADKQYYSDSLHPASMPSYLFAFILIVSSIRGWIVLHSEAPAQMVYKLSAILLLGMCGYGCLKSGGPRNYNLNQLKKLLHLNLCFGLINFAIDGLVGGLFELSPIYLYLAPYSIFIFSKMRNSHLYFSFAIVGLAIGYSVVDNFFETLRGPEGLENVLKYNTKLRPDTFDGLGRTGEFFRPGGFTGDPHDSANILALIGSLFFVRYMVKGKWHDLVLSVLSLFSVTLTQSAVNIVLMILTWGIFSIIILSHQRRVRTLIYLLATAASLSGVMVYFGDFMSIFTNRIGADGDHAGMMVRLDLDSLLHAVPHFLFGHARAFQSDMVYTELAFIKIAIELGFVHTLIFFFLLIFPLVKFLKLKDFSYEALPGLAGVFFGFISLLHYASIFRSTNVLLFYGMYSMSLKAMEPKVV
jgi:hypothetical protein